MIYLTGDQHFDHIHLRRHWNFIDAMNEALIALHNQVVTDDDEVYHLGDFCWTDKYDDFLSRLKGRRHHLVKGNHDYKYPNRLHFFDTVQDTCLIKWENKQVFCSHYAHRVWPSSHYGSYHAYAHSHGKLPSFGRSADVGVDARDFAPISIEKFIGEFPPTFQ